MQKEHAFHKTREPAPISFAQQFRDMELDDCLVINLNHVSTSIIKVRASIQNVKIGLEKDGDFRRFKTKVYPHECAIRVWRIK